MPDPSSPLPTVRAAPAGLARAPASFAAVAQPATDARRLVDGGDSDGCVPFTVDGHGVHDNLRDRAPVGTGSPVDRAQVERIEIVRGPGASPDGSHAVPAVVEAVTQPGRDRVRRACGLPRPGEAIPPMDPSPFGGRRFTVTLDAAF